MLERGKEPAYPLPVIYKPVEPYILFIKVCAARCVSLSKKAAIAALHGREVNVDDEIEEMLLQVRNHGYNNGLSDMDKMHKTLEQ